MSSKPTEELPLVSAALADLVHIAQSAGGGVFNSRSTTIASILALVVDAAPGVLDTLNELAAALGDDANFATTVMDALAAKAPDLLVPDTVAGTTYSTVAGDRYAAKLLTNAALVTVTLTDDPPVGARIRFKARGAAGCTFVAGGGMTLASRDNAVNSAGLEAVMEAHRISETEWSLLGDVTT